MLPEFPAKITGIRKARFFRNGKNRFLRGAEQFGRLCQAVLNQIRHRGNLNS